MCGEESFTDVIGSRVIRGPVNPYEQSLNVLAAIVFFALVVSSAFVRIQPDARRLARSLSFTLAALFGYVARGREQPLAASTA